MSAIRLRGISKYWSSAAALVDIHLDIAQGRLCVLLGSPGCGKCITLSIASMAKPRAAARCASRPRVTDLPRVKRGIAMVLQRLRDFHGVAACVAGHRLVLRCAIGSETITVRAQAPTGNSFFSRLRPAADRQVLDDTAAAFSMQNLASKGTRSMQAATRTPS